MNAKIDEIIDRVAAYYGESRADLLGKRRYEPLVTCRGVAMALAAESGASERDQDGAFDAAQHLVRYQSAAIGKRAAVDKVLARDLARLRAGLPVDGETFRSKWLAERRRYNCRKVANMRARRRDHRGQACSAGRVGSPLARVDWEADEVESPGRSPGYGSLNYLEEILKGITSEVKRMSNPQLA